MKEEVFLIVDLSLEMVKGMRESPNILKEKKKDINFKKKYFLMKGQSLE